MLINIWILLVLKRTLSFVLQDSYNILLKDSTHYKINQSINSYEFVTKEPTIHSQIKIEDKKFSHLDRLAKQEYDKETKHPTAPIIELYQLQEIKFMDEVFTDIKNIPTTLEFSTKTHSVDKKTVNDKGEVDYDYNDLDKEYYIETLNDLFSNKIKNEDTLKSGLLEPIFRMVSLAIKKQNCKDKSYKMENVDNNKCVKDKYRMQQQNADVILRLGHFIKIWLLVYIIIAVPMWFKRGWCCCCLICKILKPRMTIEEAKKYLILYPPGVVKIKNRIIEYEVSEQEKEKYEEFTHFLRTL